MFVAKVKELSELVLMQVIFSSSSWNMMQWTAAPENLF